MVELSLMLRIRKDVLLQIEGWVGTPNNAGLTPEQVSGLRQSSHLVLNRHEVRVFDPASLACLQRWSVASGMRRLPGCGSDWPRCPLSNRVPDWMSCWR